MWPLSCRSIAFSGEEPQPVRQARAFARWTTAPSPLAERAADVELVLGELVLNALQHGGGAIDVTAHQDQTGLVFEVRDAEPKPPEESGFGLLLVAGLASAWGHRTAPGGNGKIVWARFDAPGQAIP